jgi:hypothetical protein
MNKKVREAGRIRAHPQSLNGLYLCRGLFRQGQTKDCIDLSLSAVDGRSHHLALVYDAAGATLQTALV